MCYGEPDVGAPATRGKLKALQSYAPAASPAATTSPITTPTSTPDTGAPSTTAGSLLNGIGSFSPPVSPLPLSPAAVVSPDATSADAIQARLRERQQIEQLAGYRSTFLSGPRGPGGPSRAMQQAQLRPAPALPFTDLTPVPYKDVGEPHAGPVQTGMSTIIGKVFAESMGGIPSMEAKARSGQPVLFGNAEEEYITDPATGAVKRNPNFRRSVGGFR